MERIIGIDLGTTNSLAATVFDEGPEVIEASGESSITPSVLFLDRFRMACWRGSTEIQYL